ncbi:MAG: T9SS type A sorting domain-containing protein [Dysgonamonadaceae bacterium]|jgi:hypothetical protein|nr:T9SS type A sorting domain-containing protein [Dysgonamonadaceae bacterium]
MNKKITFILAIIAILSGSSTLVKGEKQIVTVNSYTYSAGATKPETPTSTLGKFYNQANKLDLELNSSSKSVYSYNAKGQVDTLIKYSWNANTNTWSISSKTGYEYDEAGQMTRANTYNINTDTLMSYIHYLNYEKGQYKDAKTMNYNGTAVTYWAHYDYTFDGDLVTEAIRSYKPNEETANYIDKTIYSYSNGKRTGAEVQAYVSGEWQSGISGTTTETYSYDAEGLLFKTVKSSISRYGTYIDETENIYGDLQSAYAPLNLTASVKTGAGVPVNTVELNWTASPSAAITGYKVICDSIVADVVSGTTFTTATTVQNGKHEFAVIAIAGSDYKNISNRVSLDVLDEGVKPAENLKVTGISDKLESDGSYNVTVTWDAATTNSVKTSYKIYYAEYYSVTATESPATINMASYICEGTNTEGDLYGKDIAIYVVAIYETGIAEKSNIVTVNPFNKTLSALQNVKKAATIVAYPNPATDVILLSDQAVVSEVYSLTGKKVKSVKNVSIINVSDLSSGIYLIKTINPDGQPTTQKIVVK